MAGILLNRNRQVPAEETPAFGGIAERFRRAGDLDRAIALCRDGLKRFPNQLSAKVTLGWALLDKGQYDAAREELEQVLRRAPDNLAAIRGLAELHDRAEAAMSEAAQESWRRSEENVAAAAAAEARSAAAEETHAVVEAAALATAGADESLLDEHTLSAADVSAFEESAFEAPMVEAVDLVVAPVEIEDPAAASLAAAEPTPFFVVDPAEAAAEAEASSQTPIEAFEPAAFAATPADEPAVDSDHMTLSAAADIDTDDALAAAALQMEAAPDAVHIEADTPPDTVRFDAESAPAVEAAADLLHDADWAALASLDPLSGAPQQEAASAGEPAAWAEIQTPDATQSGSSAEPDLLLDSAVPEGMLTSTADWVTASMAEAAAGPVETLEDIDETAGLELGDAIKALEDAARRVEARLAPPRSTTEPAASPETIAAFEFIDAAGQPLFGTTQAADSAGPDSIIDKSHDAAFELIAPDVGDLALGPESETAEVEFSDTPEDDDMAASDGLFTQALAFDDALLEEGAELTNEAATDTPAVVAHPGLSLVPPPVSLVAEEEVVDQLSGPDVDLESESERESEGESGATQSDAQPQDQMPAAAMSVTEPADVVAEPVSVSAPVTVLEADVEVGEQGSDLADAVTDEAAFTDISALDSPASMPVAAMVDAVAADAVAVAVETMVAHTAVAPFAGTTAQSSQARTILALEKFLRQVQARRLELHSGTVA